MELLLLSLLSTSFTISIINTDANLITGCAVAQYDTIEEFNVDSKAEYTA